MKLRYTLLIFTVLLGVQLVKAQCYTDQFQQELLDADPAMAAQYQSYLENGLPGYVEYNEDGLYKKATRVIPVVFHVIHAYGAENITKAQILDQLETLNRDYSRTNLDTGDTRSIFKSIATDMDIEFRLATVAQDGSCTDGITRTYSELTDGGDEAVKNLIRWDYRKYLNIWVVKRIERNWNPPFYVAGYATFPFTTSSTTDGIVIRHDFVGSIGTSDAGRAGRTLTHEIGHWLGLYHPFQGGCTSTNSWTDQVDDTPPVAEPSYNCPIGNNTCHNDNPDQLDQVENYMDYADGSCQNMFTIGQRNRVNSFLNDDAYRKKNTTSTAANNPQACAPVADFYTINLEKIICEGSGSLSFKDYSYNGDISSREWIFEGGTPNTSSAAEPTVSYTNSGYYDVTLIVGNGEGFDTLTRSEFITVLPSVAIRKAPFGEGFEDENFYYGWQLQSSDNDGWDRATDRGSNSSSSARCYIDENTEQNKNFALIMPPVDVSTNGMPLNLHFDYAYARRTTSSTEVLLIRVSDDCGASWKTIKGMTAANGLATVSGAIPGFVPTSQSQWAHMSLDLNGYASDQNLLFRFDVLSKGGNSVFIDNINLAQFGLGTEELAILPEFDIYPNPASAEVNISVAQEWLGGTLELTDLSGRLLLQTEIELPTQQINTSDLTNGVYVLRITKDGLYRSERLIINK